MKNKVFQIPEFREYYLSEFELYDGECFITFNIVGIDEYRNEITVAVTNRGGIGHQTFDFTTTTGCTSSTVCIAKKIVLTTSSRLRRAHIAVCFCRKTCLFRP